jgi:hypothetical protein
MSEALFRLFQAAIRELPLDDEDLRYKQIAYRFIGHYLSEAKLWVFATQQGWWCHP